MTKSGSLVWLLIAALVLCTDCKPVPEGEEEFHEPISAASKPEDLQPSESEAKPVEDAYVGENDPKPFHEPVPTDEKPSRPESGAPYDHGRPLEFPSLVNIKLDIPERKKLLAVDMDKDGNGATVYVPKGSNKKVNLDIDIPSIFQLKLGDMNTGVRRLGILAPFFKLDLTRGGTNSGLSFS